MKLRIYTVYDQAAKAWLDPFYAPTDMMAKRSFRQAANNPQHNFCMYPKDYTLVCIGEFDQENGKILPLEIPEVLGLASEFKDGDVPPS